MGDPARQPVNAFPLPVVPALPFGAGFCCWGVSVAGAWLGAPGGVCGAVPGCPGVVLGVCGAVLGCPGAVLGVCGAVLGCPGVVLGVCGAVLCGAVLGVEVGEPAVDPLC